MWKAFLYKEWLKIKWVMIIIFGVGLLLEIYMFLKLGRSFRYAGYEHFWDVIINKNHFVFGLIEYFPVASGIILAIAQFLPEMGNKRLKLSLHLPLKEEKVTSNMIFPVVGIFLTSMLLLTAIFLGGTRIFFASEMVYFFYLTILPWFLAGITAYFLGVFCITEPLWKRKIINIAISVAVLTVFFKNETQGAYMGAQWFVFIIPLVCLSLIYYSFYRYKSGIQGK